MAIYRPPKARWPVALAAALGGLLVGLLVGAVALSDDPDPRDAVVEIQSTLVSAAGSLEVAGIEYDEAVEGTEVAQDAEYDGALAAIESSRARYGEVRGALDVLAPAYAEGVDSLYAECRELMDAPAEVTAVLECLDHLESVLEEGPGPPA